MYLQWWFQWQIEYKLHTKSALIAQTLSGAMIWAYGYSCMYVYGWAWLHVSMYMQVHICGHVYACEYLCTYVCRCMGMDVYMDAHVCEDASWMSMLMDYA